MTAPTTDRRTAYQLGQWAGLAGIRFSTDDQVADYMEADGSVAIRNDASIDAFVAGYWDVRR